MFPSRCTGNPLKNGVLVLCLLLSMLYSVNAHAEDEKIVGMEVVDGTDTSASSDAPLPDLFTGTMSYRIPIAVPSGRKGVDPGIVLTYRSTNGNGWLGVGWELEMGAIERSTKGGVDYSGNGNSFVLRGPGGTTELVEISIPGTSPKEYRAKIEGNFTKFVNYGAYWEAIDKKGVRFRFGHEANTTLYDPGNSANVFKWCLDRITDKNGNYVILNYTRDQNQLYLNEIGYTGNDTFSPNLPATNSVKFILETRTDAPTIYTTNFAVTTAKRLKTIEVWGNSSLVRKYVLNYDAASTTTGNLYSPLSGRSVLGTVTEYGSDGTTTKPPITLEYSNSYIIPGGSSSGGWAQGAAFGISTPLPVGMYCIPGRFSEWSLDILCSTGSTGWDLKYLFNNLDMVGILLQWPNGQPPNLSQNSLGAKCVTGDFKGEGKNALACNFANNGDWVMVFPGGNSGEIWSKETWQNAPAVLPTQCLGGDFDGNGKSDFACYASNTWKMALSTGSGWGSSPVQWTGGPTTFTSPTSSCLPGDFNGDGKTDFACNSGASGYWKIFLSNGNGWTIMPDWGSSEIIVPADIGPSNPLSGHCRTGDYNGDGKTDITCFRTDDNKWHVALSTGSDWASSSFQAGGPSTATPIFEKCVSGDFNGDGRTDISCYTSGGAWSTALSLGNGWNTLSWSGGPSPDTSVSKQCLTGDFNGDGKTDVICYPQNAAFPGHWQLAYSGAPLTDLLTHVSNGLGGVISISYVPTKWFSRLPFTMQVVSSIAVNDGNGNSATSNYSYAGDYYNIGSKDFRGFNYAKVVGSSGPSGERTVTETWFHQGNDTVPDVNDPSASIGYMKGKPYRTRVSDNSYPPHVYSETETTYRDTPNPNPNPYYYNPPQTVDTYICDGNATGACKGNGSARQTSVGYIYDDYGNVTREDRYGDVGNAANKLLNMTIIRSFSPNTDNGNWFVGFPVSESVYQGIGVSDSGNNLKIRHTDYYYDDLAAGDCNASPTNNQTPTKGNLTRVSRWLNGNSASYSETRMAYDGYGNPVCSRDPNGNVTTTGFDSTYQTFPVSSTNAKTQTATSAYYGVGMAADKGRFGQLKSITDPNNAKTTMEYDVFSRKTKDIQPDTFWTTTAYNSFGTVGSQNIYSYNQLGMWSASYFDGLGRTFKVRKSGPDNKIIVSETVYDQRGKVSRVSLPYFEGQETPVYRTYNYDPLGRVTQVTNPDGTNTRACYNDLVSVFIDENSHRRRETRDPLGRLVIVEEYEGVYTDCDTARLTPYAATYYTYDILGNLSDVYDHYQKNTRIEYDTLGRKKNMTDPDMGYWEYGYYPDGTLNWVKDAKQQTIIFDDIDVLNRPTRKRYPADSGMADVVYAYDETTSTNPKGRLTTMTDGSGKTTWNYDLSGRPTRTVKRVDSVDYTITKAYDGLGRLDSITYPDNESVDYYYDNGGNLSEISGYAEYDEYNALGQPGKLYHGNGIVTSYWYYPLNYRLFAMKTDRLQDTLL